ncbi:hypothetical protein GCM10023324_68360 [Streptomyces youssoufiensis]
MDTWRLVSREVKGRGKDDQIAREKGRVFPASGAHAPLAKKVAGNHEIAAGGEAHYDVIAPTGKPCLAFRALGRRMPTLCLRLGIPIRSGWSYLHRRHGTCCVRWSSMEQHRLSRLSAANLPVI